MVVVAALRSLGGEAGFERGDGVEFGDGVAEEACAGGHAGDHYGDVEFDDAAGGGEYVVMGGMLGGKGEKRAYLRM